MLFFWPVLTIPITFIIMPSSLTISALISFFFVALIIVGLAKGCGARYNFRGINPGSRTVLSTIDDQYLQAKEYDVSTNK